MPKSLARKESYCHEENAPEAALIEGIEIIGVHSLVDLIAYLRGEQPIAPTVCTISSYIEQNGESSSIDFDQVKGQLQAKRALQIAAAGRHNILIYRSPWLRQNDACKAITFHYATMNFDEILDTSKIYSVSGKLHKTPLITERPFRNPHHTISQAGLVGGGSFPQPGEISLTHNGILFLDELTEFKRSTLEVLRQPLENKTVCISRAMHSISFPASFLLVAALNPCPCGFLGDKKRTLLLFKTSN